MNLFIQKSRKGFLLVELIVSMSIFVIAIFIIAGGFVRALKAQRVVIHLMAVNSNASLMLEQIAREARTGYDFMLRDASPSTCPSGESEEIEFTNAQGDQVIYKGDGGNILRKCSSGINCSGNFSPMNASDVAVTELCFINTQPDSINDPWRITLVLRAGSSKPELATNFINLQTTINSRVLPCDVTGTCPLGR